MGAIPGLPDNWDGSPLPGTPGYKPPEAPQSPAPSAGNGQQGGGSSGSSSVQGGDFVPSDVAQPFFDRQNAGTILGSYGMQAAPGAAAWQTDLFNPGFNAGEQAFMDSEAARLRRSVYDPAQARLSGQFGSTPFHSAYMDQTRRLNENMGQDLGNTALKLMQARQDRAGQAAGRIMGSPMDAFGQAQSAASDLVGMTGGLMNGYYQLPMAAASGAPLLTPSVIASPGSSGGGKK